MPKTLIIDDDPQFETHIRAHFDLGIAEGMNETLGSHHFVFARSKVEALAIMEQSNDIDIAAVTIDDPAIGGMGIFRELKDKRLRVPRIALTGTRDLSAIRAAMNAGAVDFLTKPVSMVDLEATLNKVFGDCEERRKAWRTEAQLAAVKREMDLAGTIQKRILPDDFPPTQSLEMFALTTPAREMGGDFYDFFDLADGRVALVVADVSGKGVPAAFYMAVVRTLFRAAAPQASSPAKCMEEVNRILVSHNIPGMFVTVFYAVLDPQTWTLEFSNAGHMPPLLVGREGTVKSIESGGGVVLGFDHGIAYEQDSLTLGQGEALFIYTDGLTEAFDADRQPFSEERLIDYLLENRSLSAHALATNVFAFVGAHAGDTPQSDDITSLVIRRFN